MRDSKENLQQPEDDGSLQYWMWCEEEELELHNGLEIEIFPEDDDWESLP